MAFQGHCFGSIASSRCHPFQIDPAHGSEAVRLLGLLVKKMVAVLLWLFLLLASPSMATDTPAEVLFKKAVAKGFSPSTIEESLADINAAISLSPKTGKYLILKAELAYGAEQDQESLAAATKAIKLLPKSAYAWRLRARALCRMKQPDQALNSVNVAIKIDPKDPLAYLTRAEINESVNEWVVAEHDLDKAISLQPTMYQAYEKRVDVNEKLKQWTKVITDCTTLINMNHEKRASSHNYRSRAAAYVALHKNDKAVLDLKMATKLSPDDIRIHRELESLYKRMGDKKGLAEETEIIKSLTQDY